MKKIYSIVIAAMILALTASFSFAGVAGTAHDLSSLAGGQVCVVCHAPHNAAAGLTDGILWNHAMPSTTYTMYADLDGSINGNIDAQPTGHSKLCLSCHDGTVSVDAYAGGAGTRFVAGYANLGSDLRDDHPISIIYSDDDLSATWDDGLEYADAVTLGYKPLTELLENYTGPGTGKLQCSTCHDVHDEDMAPTGSFLRAPIAGSVICGTCHFGKL